MKQSKVHIRTINKNVLTQTLKNSGCGECPTSCQSACKTSCTVSNQECQK
jgi:predicted ribosomally synthesized six-cysteine peptide SCIFF